MGISPMILIFIGTELYGRIWAMQPDLSLNLGSATYWLNDLSQKHRLLEGTTKWHTKASNAMHGAHSHSRHHTFPGEIV